MNDIFLNQRYNNFIDNKITKNNNNSQKFSQTYYKPKNPRESSDLVLQKMQLSLNNFLTNLKKNENIESYLAHKEDQTSDRDKSLNFNSNTLSHNYSNFQSINSLNEGFFRGKERSEANLIQKKINRNDDSNIFRSPFDQEKSQKGFSLFSNSMYSFNNFHNNGQNNISSNFINSNNIKNNDNIYNNSNTIDNNYKFHHRGNQRSNTEVSNIFPQSNNEIFISENSSYSSDENNKIQNNNNNNNLKNVKNDEVMNTMNNIDYDYKKIVQKIKDKKANEQKEKEKKKSDINIFNNVSNPNNSSGVKFKLSNEEIFSSSNNKEENKIRNISRINRLKENTISLANAYTESNDKLYSNSTILNKDRNILESNIMGKDFIKDNDNDNDNNNNDFYSHKTNHRSVKKLIEDQIVPIEENIIDKKYTTISNINSEIANNNIHSKGESSSMYKVIKNKKFKKDNKREMKKENSKIKNIKNIKTDMADAIQDNHLAISIKNEKPKEAWMKTYTSSYYNSILNNKDKNNENRHISRSKNKERINNISSKNIKNIKKNNKDENEEKNKILDKLIFENNMLKEKIANKGNERHLLNSEPKNNKDWDTHKLQQRIKELESKLSDSKNIKSQITILKSQRTNLYKDYYKYKELAESLKSENEKLLKEKDEYKKQRDILNNEVQILKLNINPGHHKNNIAKAYSRQRLLTTQSERSGDDKGKGKYKNNTEKFSTINLPIDSNKDNLIDPNFFFNQNINKFNVTIIVKNDNFSILRNSNIDDSEIKDTGKLKEMEKVINEKDQIISNYKEKIQYLENEKKDDKEIKKNEKLKKKKSNNNVKTDDKNNPEKINNSKYLDEINELRNNIKKLENEKTLLKNKIDIIENKKINNNMQKQIADLKKQINYSNNQVKTFKTKANEFDELFLMIKSFIKMIKPSNDKEKDLYYKLKNYIEHLDKEKISK